MRLGTQTASLNNWMYSRGTIGQPKPEVGMGATVLMWTDRQAATITEVIELAGKTYQYEIRVVDDRDVVVSGSTQDGSAEYGYEPRKAAPGEGRLYRSLRKTGEWVSGYFNEETGKFNRSNGDGLRIGERETYRDPSF